MLITSSADYFDILICLLTAVKVKVVIFTVLGLIYYQYTGNLLNVLKVY